MGKLDNLRSSRKPKYWGIVYWFGAIENYIYFDNFYVFKRWVKIWKRLYNMFIHKRRRYIVGILDKFIISDLTQIVYKYVKCSK